MSTTIYFILCINKCCIIINATTNIKSVKISQPMRSVVGYLHGAMDVASCLKIVLSHIFLAGFLCQKFQLFINNNKISF